MKFRGIPCPFWYTEFRNLKRKIHWGEIWEEIRREREIAKEIEGKEIEGKRGRDRRKETKGKRQVERDRGKETSGKGHRERDIKRERDIWRTGHRKRDIGKETEDQIKRGKDRGGIEGDR